MEGVGMGIAGAETKLKRARTAAQLSQNEVARALVVARRARGFGVVPKDESVLRQYKAWESGKVRPSDWHDELCEVLKASPQTLGLVDDAEATSSQLVIAKSVPRLADYGDASYLEHARADLSRLVALDNRFGAADIVRMSYKFFKSLQNLVGIGAYDRALERDFNALIGEAAELTGWLAYDAELHKLVRQMNNESLLYTRLAGDRSIELLTLQNSSMHAGAMGRPGEALHVARSVLEGDYSLSPRLRALFLIRMARALAQDGDESALALFDEIESLYLEGVQEGDPAWAWWIDDRELAWHKAMAAQDVNKSSLSMAEFERSVEATAPTETRSQYLHRAYLLLIQVDSASWDNVEGTIKTLLPLISEVESTRTKVLLRDAISKVATRQKVPGKISAGIAQLGIALDEADLTEVW